MTDQEILSAFKQIYEYKKEIAKLQDERRTQEFALNVEYRVDECNGKKNKIILDYQQLVNEKLAQIKLLEDQLGTKAV